MTESKIYIRGRCAFIIETEDGKVKTITLKDRVFPGPYKTKNGQGEYTYLGVGNNSFEHSGIKFNFYKDAEIKTEHDWKRCEKLDVPRRREGDDVRDGRDSAQLSGIVDAKVSSGGDGSSGSSKIDVGHVTDVPDGESGYRIVERKGPSPRGRGAFRAVRGQRGGRLNSSSNGRVGSSKGKSSRYGKVKPESNGPVDQ